MTGQSYNEPYPYYQPQPPPEWQPPARSRRGGRVGKAIALLVVALLLLYILLYTPLAGFLLSGMMGNTYPKSAAFTLSRVITIDISREVSYSCDIPIPTSLSFSGGNVQRVSDIDIVPPGTRISKYDGSWIEWAGTDAGQVSLSLTCQASVNTVIWDIDSQTSGMPADISSSIFAAQMDDEWNITDDEGEPTGGYKIWPSHPTINALAETLASEELTVYDNAKRIYEYIRNNIEYRTFSGSEAKPCIQTLGDGSGDCDDQSILLISLLRSAGIPSWLAFGALHDDVRGEWGPHAWAELYIPLKTGGGENVVIDPANGEFLVRNCNRLEEWKSDGNGEHLDDYYHLLSYNYSAMPGQPAPVVTVSDSYHGEFRASSERVHALLPALEALDAMIIHADCTLPSPRKVF